MKTKTIIKILSVFFTLTLFMTSCATDEITVNELGNATNENNYNSLQNRTNDNSADPLQETQTLTILYIEGVSTIKKTQFRLKYNAVSYTYINSISEVWFIPLNPGETAATSTGPGGGPLSSEIEDEEEIIITLL